MTIKDIPDKTLQGFKAFAALSGKSMNQLIIEYMKEKAEQVQLKDK